MKTTAILSIGVALGVWISISVLPPTITKSDWYKVIIKESDEKKCIKAGGEIHIYGESLLGGTKGWQCESKVIDL